MAGTLPPDFAAKADAFVAAQAAKAQTVATRKASQQAIEAFAPLLPEMIGGSADLTGSVFTNWSGSKVGHARRTRQLRELRRARVRHDCDRQRPRAAWRLHSVRRHVPDVLRLRAQRIAHGGADEAALDLRVHARLDRPRRGRPHAPVGRARGEPCASFPGWTSGGRATPSRRRSPGQPRSSARTGRRACCFTRQNVALRATRRPRRSPAIARGGYVLADFDASRKAAGRADRHRLRGRARPGRARGARRRKASPRASCRCPAPSVFDRQDAAYRASVLPARRAARRGRGRRHRWLAQIRRRGRRSERRGSRHRHLRRIGAGRVLFKHFGFTVEHVVATVRRVLGAQ